MKNANLINRFLSFQAKIFCIGNSKLCEMTQFSAAEDKGEFDGNTLLLECEKN